MPGPESHGLVVHMEMDKKTIDVGEQTDVRLGVLNQRDTAIAMPTVVIPVPAGFRVDPKSLKRLKQKGLITRFDDRGDEVHLYVVSLNPRAAAFFPYRLEATARCDVMQHPARAFAYYDPSIYGSSGPARISGT